MYLNLSKLAAEVKIRAIEGNWYRYWYELDSYQNGLSEIANLNFMLGNFPLLVGGDICVPVYLASL